MSERIALLSGRRAECAAPNERHFHSGYELIFVEKGEIGVIIGKKEFVAAEGAVVCIGNFDEHRVTVRKTPYERTFLILDGAETDRSLADPAALAMFKSRAEGGSPVFPLPKAEFTEMTAAASRILAEFAQNAPYSGRIVNAELTALLLRLSRAVAPQMPYLSAPQFTTASRIQRFLDENFAEALTLDGVAETFFLNKFYLSHVFKRYVGYSVMQYLTKARLAHAKKLLRETELSVREIAARCNFGDESNFIRCFKKEFGGTPLSYRKQANAEG